MGGLTGDPRAAAALRAAYGDALLALWPLAGLAAALSALSPGRHGPEAANTLLPFLFIAILAALARRTLRAMPEAIWSAAFWLPVQAAVFTGFGPLVEVFGNEATRAALAAHPLALSAEALLGANALAMLGATLLLTGVWAHMAAAPRAWAAAWPTAGAGADPLRIGLAFVALGGALKYLLINPAQWGLVDLLAPGVVTNLGALADLGFALLAYAAAAGRRGARAAFWALWPAHLALAALSFAKLDIVLALLFPAIGAFLAHRSALRLVLALALAGAVYAAAQPFVHHGRAAVAESTGTANGAGYGARLAIAQAYLDAPTWGPAAEEPTPQGWWTRLSFAGPQAFAMEARARGLAYRPLADAWMHFVPRALWPEKPVLPGPGLEVHRLVTGEAKAESFLALSIYGDLFWQFGWAGIWLGCPAIGWLFAMMAARSVAAVRARAFLMLPAVLLALEMAILGPNRFVVTGILGPLPIYAAYLLATGALLGLGGRRPGSAPRFRSARARGRPFQVS